MEEVLFKGKKIKIIRNESGTIKHVCVSDICLALNRKLLIEDGTVGRKCPSVSKLDENNPSDLYAVFTEGISLIKSIRRKNKIIEDDCSKLIVILEVERVQKPKTELTILSSEKLAEQKPMSATLQQFQYGDTHFTMKMEDGRIMFNATEMARGYSRRPKEWLSMVDTKDYREALVRDGKSPNLESQVFTTRGAHGSTWIESHLVMNFAQWLSPDFAVWCSKTLVTLMNEGEVKLQDIVPQRDGVSNFPVPATYEEALSVIEQQNKLIAIKEQEIQDNKVKTDFYDDYIGSREYFTTSQIAVELGTHATQLNIFLRDHDIQEKKGRDWVLNPQFRALQSTFYHGWENPKTRYMHQFKKIAWTPEGREYIVGLWKDKYIK